MYQRSADIGLGVPFNIASYALLTHMMAHVCNLECGEFIHTIGDAHIYLNHVDKLVEQVDREPYEFPTLKIDKNITNIDEFRYEDFILENYNCHSKIGMKMAI